MLCVIVTNQDLSKRKKLVDCLITEEIKTPLSKIPLVNKLLLAGNIY